MVKKWLQLLFAVLGGLLGFYAGKIAERPVTELMESVLGVSGWKGESYWFMAAGAVIFFWAASWMADYGMRLIHRCEEKLENVPVPDLLAGIVGLIVGLLISVLLFPSLAKMGWAGTVLPVLMTIFLGYAGFRIGYKKKEEMVSLFSVNGYTKERRRDPKIFEEHKILDTSVIIDGRIADICKTGFIEGTLVIPEFVLEELQHIADSSDLLKRNRGRRGLDILNKIQKELDVKVLIYEGDFEEISEVDSKLVKLAKVLQGKVITNDFNLNKVCELQGVSVLNINDLANAVKPVVLPGEEILVQVIKDGKEYGQGVAYLDDGTMIVVEGGRDFIGMNLEVLVTSVLQTSAGRMIFAKPKLLEKAL